MSPEVLVQILVLLMLLFMSALISGSEVAYFSLRPADLLGMQDGEHKSDNLVHKLIIRPKRLLATILIANNLVNIAAVILSTAITASLFDFSQNPTGGFVIQVVVVTFLLVLFGEVLPKIYATQHPKDFARNMSIPLLVMDKLFRPFSMLMVAGTNLIDKRMKKKGYEVSMDDLTHAIDITSDNTTAPEDKQMLKGIVKFGDTDVKQIMKGRMDAFAIEIDTPFDEVIVQILEKGYSRIPIYENNFDKVLGILYIKDLLAHLHKGPEFKWQELLRPVFYVPESKKINALLKEFQDTKIHLAIVVDEYGGSSGLVTLEDILEEIVGEINDELDEEDISYSRLDDNNVIFEGKALLNDVCRIMNVERKIFEKLEGEGADTLAGLLLEVAGRIPLKNDEIEIANFRFKIESVDKRRIKRVKMTVLNDENEQGVKQNLYVLLPLIICSMLFIGCNEDYTPKPRGFFRIELPDHSYKTFDPDSCPFSFEHPEYSNVEPVLGPNSEPFWYNIKFPLLNGEINLSYKKVNNDLNQFLEDSRTLAYQHTVKASAINEVLIQTDNPNVHGILYELQGNTASPIQFFVTDSTKHFLRGSLYFNVSPQSDSLAPVIAHTREDIMQIIRTLRWK